MNILFLSITDQQEHPLGKYVDLHCNYDFNSWIDGFSSLDHNIFSFDYYEYFVKKGPIALSKKILALCRKHNIETIIIPNMWFEISLVLLNSLRNKKIKTILIFFDDGARFNSCTRFYISFSDFIVSHESKKILKLYSEHNIKASFFPCFPSITSYNKIIDKETKPIPNLGKISFVGAKIADRSDFLEKLSENQGSISIYGNGWPSGRISQKEMLQVYKDSEISLNFTKNESPKSEKQLKARSFEIILAGGFLLTEYDEELLDYFVPGEEIETFTNLNECSEKINYFLNNPIKRNQMQRAAYMKCLNQYNFEAAWSNYLVEVEKNINCNYFNHQPSKLPLEAMITFSSWSAKHILGRILTRDLRLAKDHLKFSIEQLKNYLGNSIISSLFILCLFFLYFPITYLKNLLIKFASKLFLLR